MIDSQAEKLRELDQEMRPFRQSWEEAGGVRSSVESLQSRVAELESVDKGAGQAVRNTGEGGGSGGAWDRCGAVRLASGGACCPVMGDTCAEVSSPEVLCQTRPLHARPAWSGAGVGWHQ